MRWLDKMGPVMLKHGDTESMYYPIGLSVTKDRALGEARLMRRLGYRAQVLQYNNDRAEMRYVLMISHQYLYNSSGV